MASISTSIQLHNGMSSVLQSMTSSLNLVLSSFEAVQNAADRSIDPASWEAARQEMANAGAALTRYREELERISRTPPPTPAPDPSWNQLSGQAVFMNSGADRFRSEIQAANTAAAQLVEMQARISRQANLMRVVPPGMMNDVTAVQDRMQSLQQRIQQLNSIPLNMRTDRANNELEQLRGLLTQAGQIQERLNAAMSDMDISAANAGFQRLNALLGNAERGIRDMDTGQQQFNNSVRSGASQLDGMGRKIMSMIAMYASFQGAKKAIDMSDSYTQTIARIDLMNDGAQTTEELTNKIYASAQRSRAPFMGTASAIAKMGINAKNAFQSNDELIAFMEQVNKQFVIGGATSQEMANATVQLSQAMAKGTLRGQDLNSILEGAPGIARAIEKNMGWAEGSIKSYAEKGAVSAQVVKNSLLNMADETNKKFEQMPMTWGQAWDSIKNTALMAFSPVLDKINDFISSDTGQVIINNITNGLIFLADIASGVVDLFARGAQMIIDNWEYIAPLLMGIAAAIGIAMLVSAAMAFASWIMAAWPFLLIAAVITAVMIALRKAGVTFEQIGEVVGGVFGYIYAVGYNAVADLWNMIAAFAEFFANVFNDPVGAVVRLYFDLSDNILSQLENVAQAIDALFHTDFSSVISGFRGQLSSWVGDTFGENAIKVERMAKLDVESSMERGGEIGKGLGNKMDHMSLNMDNLLSGMGGMQDTWEGIGNNTGDTAGNTAKMADSMDILDEELKYLRDAAEQEVINRFTLADLKIDVSNNNTLTTKTDFDDVNRQLGEITAEMLAVAAEGAYA